ncbi:hypothetical protein LNAOJCKE_4949 [Methylorubrum aminovorans]|uniref:Uncharacterized protein n=1 Tax=Methylorubrum aminovorans TaxID=269069 RepID=A0ABQ4UMX1_9HYPH|nr:hypothetical protein [Methylorubrum aminovorans]GJE67717.1 hypothetical protein LNAOJCKE_4949 [Methylorubrum aminovorans]GMA77911.1 hypothetical protein GCM10025880_43280 [Methylorubrum aminovorans]
MGRKRPHSFEGRTFGRLERVVTALVEAGQQDHASAPPNLIERLRDLERNAAAGGDRQVLQVIASGRRLLGDEQAVTDPRVLTDGAIVSVLVEDGAVSVYPTVGSMARPVSPAGTSATAPPDRLHPYDRRT